MLSIVTTLYRDSGLTAVTLNNIMASATIPYEHIIVDNGPETAGCPQMPHVRYYRHETDCLAAAWNFGVSKARADHIMVIGPGVFTSMGWDSVAYDCLINNAIIGQRMRQRLTPYLEGWCFGFNRAVFEKVGTFDEDFKPCFYEDTEWCARAYHLDVPLQAVNLGASHERSGIIRQFLTTEEIVAIDKRNGKLYEEKVNAFTHRRTLP